MGTTIGDLQGLLLGSIPPFPTKNQTEVRHPSNRVQSRINNLLKPGNPGLADDLILETGWVWALPQTLTLSLKP